MASTISNMNGRRVLLWQLVCLMSPLSCALDTQPDASAPQQPAAGPVAGRAAAPPESVVAGPPRAAAVMSSASMAAVPPPPPPPIASAMPSTMMLPSAGAAATAGAAGGVSASPPPAAAGSNAAGAPAQAGAAAAPEDPADALQQLALLLTNRSAASPARIVEAFEWLSTTAACEVTARRQCEFVCSLVGPGCAVCGGKHECTQAIARLCGNKADCE